jgi:hypothetical protein
VVAPPASEPDARRRLGDAAYATLVELMALPRGLGDPRRGAAIDALAQRFVALGAEVERIEHRAYDPGTGQAHELVTLMAHVRPAAPRRVVLATHFDTRPWADEAGDPREHTQPVPGANDGTSGLAVILTVLPLLAAELPPDVGVTAIAFDGEELGRPDVPGGYCAGSRELARRRAAGQLPRLRGAAFGVVLDMVGDRELDLPWERTSDGFHPELRAHVWATARTAGLTAFRDAPGPAVIDDHTFLSQAGIPSILVIDYDYPAWHTPADDLTQVSAESLGAVAEAVRLAITRWPW